MKARFQLALMAFFWGVSFPLTKVLLDEQSTFQLMAMRFGIATLALILIFKRRLAWNTSFKSGLGLGLLLFFGYAANVYGMKHTSSSHAAFISGGIVVFVALINAMITRSYLPRDVLVRLALMMFGLGMLTGMDFSAAYFGDLLQVVSALLFALQIIFVSRLPMTVDAPSLVIVQMGTITVLSFAIEMTLGSFTEMHLTSYGWFALLFTSLVATAWTFVTQVKSQQTVKATHAAIILAAEPVWGFLSSIFLLDETLAPVSAVGGALIFVSSLPVFWRE